MCLIIQGKPKDFNKEIIKKAFTQNPDGFGLMYLSKTTNRIVFKKFYTKKLNKIYKTCKEHFKKCDEIALHFRITTQGNTNNKNCHPFQVLNQDNDRIDLFLMHNSPRIPSPLLTENMSDSYYFSKVILRPILKNNYKLIKNDEFIKCLESIISSECPSRVLLLDNLTKSFQFLGDWSEHKGLKYSNENIIPNTKYWNNGYYNNYNQVHFDRSYREDYSTSNIPKIKVQENTTNNENVAQDIQDFLDMISGLKEDEIREQVEENPEIVAQIILASTNGYDINDINDLKVFEKENYNSDIPYFDDTKPITNNNNNNIERSKNEN